MIDKTKKVDRVKPSDEVKSTLEKLQRYASNYLSLQNIAIQSDTDKLAQSPTISEASSEIGNLNVDQPEVESLMPNVRISLLFNYQLKYLII